MAELMLGRELAAEIKRKVETRTAELDEHGVRAGLGLICAGADRSCREYCAAAGASARRAGLTPFRCELPEDTTLGEVVNAIRAFNADASVDGILLLLPLPRRIDARRAVNEIAMGKDVDGVSSASIGRLASDESVFQIFGAGRYDELQDRTTRMQAPAFLPCTPFGVVRLLEHYHVPLRGSRAVVVGKSNTVGKPVAMMLLAKGATVTVCHSGTKDLGAHVREADIVCSAAGVPGLVRGHMIKPGAAVVDVGYNVLGDGRICGDVAFEEAGEQAALLTPVPGGVGPVTIAILLENTVRSARRKYLND